MIKIISAITAIGAAVIIDLGRLPYLTWTDGGPGYRVAVFNGGEEPGNWWDGIGLASLWQMHDGSGTTANDNISTITGTLANNSWTNFGGVTSPYFNGSSQYVTVGDNYDKGTSNVMYTCWFYMPSAPGGNTGLISKGSGYPYQILTLINASRILNLQLRNGDSATIVSITGAAVSTGAWHHYACVIEGASGSYMMLDGALYASSAVDLTSYDFNTDQPLVFGSRLIATTYFKGGIADAAVMYNCDTNCAIQIYNASKSKYGH